MLYGQIMQMFTQIKLLHKSVNDRLPILRYIFGAE